MTKICITSDLHGHLPEIPDCDLLLLCGDYSPNPDSELAWLEKSFKPWINELSRRMTVVGCAGNHDIAFENMKQLIPKMNWVYLEDSGFEFNGLKIWGSPHQPVFFNWAFNKEEHQLRKYWNLIPYNIDILITHGPPYKILDMSPYGNKNVGSYTLAEKVFDVRPRVHAFGHIHFSYGIEEKEKIKFINAALCDERYNPVNPVVEIEL